MALLAMVIKPEMYMLLLFALVCLGDYYANPGTRENAQARAVQYSQAGGFSLNYHP